jgi:hypothetical protein
MSFIHLSILSVPLIHLLSFASQGYFKFVCTIWNACIRARVVMALVCHAQYWDMAYQVTQLQCVCLKANMSEQYNFKFGVRPHYLRYNGPSGYLDENPLRW